ncbi:MAG: Fe-S cluster assembly protein SufD [Gemmataceae bacterium]
MTTITSDRVSNAKSHLVAFDSVEQTLPGQHRPAIARGRRGALAQFGELSFPSERHEDWKFTSLNRLTRTPLALGGAGGVRVEVEGSLPAGVVVLPLAEALKQHPELVEAHLGQHSPVRTQPLAALTSAFWNDGVFVYVPDGVVVETPIQVVYEPPHEGEPAFYHRRLLAVFGARTQATLAELHTGPGGVRATSVVAECILGEGAVVDHYKIQEESTEAFHLSCMQVVVPARANFSTHYVGLGGSLVRNEVRVLFTGQHAEATVNGLYLARGSQHMDNHTVIDHAQPNCASHELYKGILDGKAHGVFNGKIFVRQDAQKTDAKQTNQTLLLSDDATINTKPQLEIYADDVKCTHGATVGQLDEQQLYYLRSRAIGLEQARALLTFAFANDIVNRVKVPTLRARLEAALLEVNHLPRLESAE